MLKAPLFTQDISADFLFEAQAAYYRFILIKAALENKIFEILTTPHSARRVAALLDKDEEIVTRMLQALMAQGLLEQQGQQFVNAPVAARYCVRSSPEYLADVVLFNDMYFGETLRRQAGALAPSETQDQWSAEQFALGLQAGEHFARAGAARQAAAVVKALPQFAACTSLLDVGCGSGLLGLEIAKAKQDLRLFLADLPAVLAETRKKVQQHECAERTDFIEADIFRDPLPGSYDLILASDSLYAAPDLADCLARLRALLAPGGVLVLRHLESSCDAHAPKHNALLRFGGALIGMPGYVFAAETLPHALREAGLSLLQSQTENYFGHAYVIHTATAGRAD